MLLEISAQSHIFESIINAMVAHSPSTIGSNASNAFITVPPGASLLKWCKFHPCALRLVSKHTCATIDGPLKYAKWRKHIHHTLRLLVKQSVEKGIDAGMVLFKHKTYVAFIETLSASQSEHKPPYRFEDDTFDSFMCIPWIRELVISEICNIRQLRFARLVGYPSSANVASCTIAAFKFIFATTLLPGMVGSFDRRNRCVRMTIEESGGFPDCGKSGIPSWGFELYQCVMRVFIELAEHEMLNAKCDTSDGVCYLRVICQNIILNLKWRVAQRALCSNRTGNCTETALLCWLIEELQPRSPVTLFRVFHGHSNQPVFPTISPLEREIPICEALSLPLFNLLVKYVDLGIKDLTRVESYEFGIEHMGDRFSTFLDALSTLSQGHLMSVFQILINTGREAELFCYMPFMQASKFREELATLLLDHDIRQLRTRVHMSIVGTDEAIVKCHAPSMDCLMVPRRWPGALDTWPLQNSTDGECHRLFGRMVDQLLRDRIRFVSSTKNIVLSLMRFDVLDVRRYAVEWMGKILDTLGGEALTFIPFDVIVKSDKLRIFVLTRLEANHMLARYFDNKSMTIDAKSIHSEADERGSPLAHVRLERNEFVNRIETLKESRAWLGSMASM